MRRVAVVTDSTADIPPDLVSDLGITVVACQLFFGEESYRDGVDLSSQEFYQKLARSSEIPTTSQPPVSAFVEAYRQLLEGDGYEAVVSIHIAGSLSGTLNSAWAAVQALPEPSRVEIVDSGQVSMGMGWAVVEAARQAQAGATQAAVVERARSCLPRLRTAAMIDTLENLYKGGRISLFSTAVGVALQIKPLISLQDGDLAVWAKVRTRSKALNALVERMLGWGPLAEVAVLHTDAQDLAQMLAGRLQEAMPAQEMRILAAGSALTSHLGLGAVGACALLDEASSQ
jgi:DegV family protein with EDD domain